MTPAQMTQTLQAQTTQAHTKKTADAVHRATRAPGNNLINFLDIELTERCNLACAHCYIRRPLADGDAITNEMSGDFIHRLLEEAVCFGCKGVRFTGGEPLARKDFKNIYMHAHSLLKVTIATNATLITNELAEMFANHRPEAVGISIYGWDAKTYDATVGVSGSFERFITGVTKLNERGIPFHMKYPPTKELVRNSRHVRNLAKSLGVAASLPNVWELTLHARNNKEACKRIVEMRIAPEEAAHQRLRERGVAWHDLNAILRKRKIPTGKMFQCRAAKKRLTIDAYGKLQVCLEMRHPTTTYDLAAGSLSDALACHIKKMREMRIDSSYRCLRCLLYPACPQCPACAYMENGVLDKPPEYHCQVMHAEARLLGLLKDGETGWEISSLHIPSIKALRFLI